MESRVSNREAKFNEFNKSQDEFKISQAKFRAEVKTTNDLILLQLKLLAEKLGVESSAATPMHQPFVKMTSHIFVEKSNQVVIQLQSFHEEKIRAREKVAEFWSQFRLRYKPKTCPCLRPILKKFKKVRDYGKNHNDDSATFRSNPRFQESSWFFRSELARKNETVFDLVNKKTEDSVMVSPVLDSDCMKSKIQACILGSAFLVSNVQKSNFTDHGYGRVGSVKERFKSPDFSISHGIVIDFSIRFDVGFLLDAKQMLIPVEGVGVRLGHNVFDEFPHSTYNCVLQLGYHMSISDSGGTLIIEHFTSEFQEKDAYNSKFLVCHGEFLKNGTTDLQDEIVLVVSNFCDKKSDESKITVVGFVGFYPFLNAQPSILENECQQELVGMYAHHVVVGMPQTVSIASLKLGFHEFTRDKGGTTIQMPFHSKSATVLESDCANGKSRVFILEIHVSNVEFKKAKLPSSCALYLFDKMSNLGYILDIKLGYHMSICDKCGTNSLFSFESIDLLASCKDSSFCVVIDRSMGYYCKGTRDKGGTISQRLFNSKSKNTDCVLGFDCSKVIKCEVCFDSSMIIDGEDAGNLGLHHLEACMDKNRKNERTFTLSRFETGCCVFCYVVLDRGYYKGIRDKGGGSRFRYMVTLNIHFSCMNASRDSIECSQDGIFGVVLLVAYSTCIVVGGEFYSSNIELSRVRTMIVSIVREEYLVLSFHRQKKFPFGSSVHGSFGLPDTSHILEDGILTGRRMMTTSDHSCEYDEHKKVDAAFTGAQMIYNSNSKFSIISEYKDVVDGVWISHDIELRLGSRKISCIRKPIGKLTKMHVGFLHHQNLVFWICPRRRTVRQERGGMENWSSASKLVTVKHLHYEGALNGAVLLCLGISIGIISSFVTNKRDVDKLKDLLKQTENLVDDRAMQVVACLQVQYVSIEDIPESIVHKDKELGRQRKDLMFSPENIRERIVEGRISNRLGELALLEQPFIKDDILLAKDLPSISSNPDFMDLSKC